MGTVEARASRTIPAPAAEVYRLLTDPNRRRDLLPEAYADVRVVPGDDARVTYTLHAARRVREYDVRIVPVEPDAKVRDEDQRSTLRTEWMLTPAGAGTDVRVHTSWQGAGGVGGFFERTFAPKGVARLHEQTLERLAGLVG